MLNIFFCAIIGSFPPTYNTYIYSGAIDDATASGGHQRLRSCMHRGLVHA